MPYNKYTYEEMTIQIQQIMSFCLEKHKGGESYFTELDGLIKSNLDLISSFVMDVITKVNTVNVITSGEFGSKVFECYRDGLISCNVNLICLNGGLRKGNTPEEKHKVYGFPERLSEPWVFIDDSYYSGKTLEQADWYMWFHENNATIKCAYVLYDGSPKKENYVESLVRYYDQAF